MCVRLQVDRGNCEGLRSSYYAASLMNLRNNWTLLPSVLARQISVTTQYWISLNRRKNRSKLDLILRKGCAPVT